MVNTYEQKDKNGENLYIELYSCFLIVFTELFGAGDDKVTSASNDSVSTLTNERVNEYIFRRLSQPGNSKHSITSDPWTESHTRHKMQHRQVKLQS